MQSKQVVGISFLMTHPHSSSSKGLTFSKINMKSGMESCAWWTLKELSLKGKRAKEQAKKSFHQFDPNNQHFYCVVNKIFLDLQKYLTKNVII